MDNKIIYAVSGRNIAEIWNGLSETYYKNIDIKHSILGKVSELIANGFTDFILNADYGFSLWAAEIIIGLRNIHLEQGL